MSPDTPVRLRRLACLFAVMAAPLMPAATYYVSPTGSDGNPGTSAGAPWQTLAKVNGATFAAGDQILFESGKTFTAPAGTDALIIKNAGSSNTNRITYGIYNGTARAVIQQTATNKNGIKFASTNDWVTVQDLEVVGPHVWTPTTAGAETPYGIYLQGSSGNALQGATLQRLVVRNFKGSGVRSNFYERLTDIRIEYVEVYHVGDAGIRLGSDGDPQDGEYRQNLYIGHCYVHHTAGFTGGGLHHGDGIQIACGKNVTVEYCVVHDTATAFGGTDGGPVGIWFADVHNGVIQFCESYNNSNGTHSVDGGGIDLDGGCLDSVIQYCYTHDNDGPGYLLAHWSTSTGGGSATNRNTFRYNISINDSKASAQGALSFWSRNAAATLDNRAYNNLVVQTRAGRTNDCIARESAIGTAGNPLRVYNNIFITSNGHPFTNTASSTSFIMKNNIWWALDGNFNYDTHTLATVDVDGLEADPLITRPQSLSTPPAVGFANIDQMPQILAAHFKLLAASPAIDTGADLTTAGYGSLSVGIRDFFANLVPQNGAYDIGHHERAPGAAGELSLTGVAASGAEGTSLAVTVARTGGTTGAVSVLVKSKNGTATAGSDFTAVNTTLAWANGDGANKAVTIPLTDDAAYEGNESFALILSDASGAELTGPATVIATVADNDVPSASSYTNRLPIAGGDPFVTPGGDGKYYLYFTKSDGTSNRLDSTDLVTWSNEQTAYSVASPVTDAQAPHVTYDTLSDRWWFFGNNETASAPAATGPFLKVNDNWGFSPWQFTDPADGQSYLFTGSGASGGTRHKTEVLGSPTYTTQTVYPHFLDAWWGGTWEGGAIIKNGGTYYWFMSINGPTQSSYRVAYATAASALGPWTIQTAESDACFLRQSNLESIYGTGHVTFHTDVRGTQWLYYQQKETNTTVADRYITLDPVWFDASGVPHVRPTRGVSRPGPNSLPSAIWPAVNATSTIQAESYAGSSIVALASGGTGTLVGTVRNQAYLAYRNVDFGAGLAGITVNLSSGIADTGVIGSIEVRTGGVNGPLVGVLPVTKTGSWTTFTSFNGALTSTVTGVNDVFLVFHGIRPGTELMRLDWLTFTASGAANTNLPPVANNDVVDCALNGSVTFNVLANDTDPEGAALTLTGVSNPTVVNRSFRASANNITWTGAGSVTYTAPSATYWGDDVFFYTVKDASGGYKTGSVKVRIFPGAALKTEVAGLAFFEAEDYNDLALNSDTNGNWFSATTEAGYAGGGYMTTTDSGTSTINNTAYLDYAVAVETPGLYTIWVRCSQPDANGNSSQLGLTTAPAASLIDRTAVTVDNVVTAGWYWRKLPEQRALRPGVHRLRINRQDDGHRVDRFVITNDANYDPSTVNGGVGPL